MLFIGWEVRIGKNCARGLEYGPRPQAEGTVFPYTNRPKPVNNIFIFFLFVTENEHGKLVCKVFLRTLRRIITVEINL